jgi:CBS domain-containing protein
MELEQVMTRAPRTCTPDDSLQQAARIMWDGDCGCVPVVDSKGRATAMITDRDICMAAYLQQLPLESIPVQRAASTQLFSVSETSTAEDALTLMAKYQVRRLVVVDAERRPVGLVSMNDVVRHTRGVSRHKDGLSPDDVVHALAAIGQSNVPHFAAAE